MPAEDFRQNGRIITPAMSQQGDWMDLETTSLRERLDLGPRRADESHTQSQPRQADAQVKGGCNGARATALMKHLHHGWYHETGMP
jgi:hypothetical protein